MDDTLRLLFAGLSAEAAALIARTLEQGEFSPEWRAVQGPEALAAALDDRAWDALIVDYGTPWTAGATPFDLVRRRGLDLPVLVMTDSVGGAATVALMRAGAHDVLPRSSLDLLAPALRRELRDARSRTERRQAELALRAAEGRFRRLFEESGDAIFVVEKATGQYVDANQAAERLTGRSVQDLRGLTTADVAPAGARERLASLADGTARSYGEVDYVRPDGTVRTALLSIVHVDQAVIYGIARDITEQKRADDALHALLRATTAVGEAFFEALVRELALALGASHVLVGELVPGDDPRVRTVAVWRNGAAVPNFDYPLRGTPCEQVVGRALSYIPSGVAAAYPEDPYLAEAGLESYIGMPLFRRNGAPAGVLVVMHTRPLDDPDLAQSLVRLFAARVEGELERLQAEDAIQHQREELQSILSAVPTGIAVIVRGLVRSVNQRACEMTGYTEAEMLGRGTRYLFEDDAEYERIQREIGRLRHDEDAGATETRLLRSDGISIDVLLSWAPIDRAHAERGVTLTALDISTRKLAEERLRRLGAAIDQSEEGVMITDPDGVIEYVNPAFERITGYAPDEALYQHSRILRSGTQEPGFYDQLWSTITAGRPWTGKMVNRRKDGTLYHQDCTITPVIGSGGRIERFVAAMRDVTKSLQLEEALRQSQRVESLGRLAAMVAHDFNNLLSPILGYAELLLADMHVQDERRADVREIELAARRARELTRQLLAFGRKQTLQIRPVDLNHVASGLVRLLRGALREDVRLSIVPHPRPCVVMADQGQAEQVVLNLAVNAQDAMPSGGQLTLRIDAIHLTQDDCAARPGLLPGRYGVLIVADTGSGMDRATRERIFEPFFTTKGEKGTGLGLSTVYGIVKQHDGHINVDSEPGRGTVFEVYLPATDASPEPDAAPAPRVVVRAASETVLVVEDNEAVRHLTESVLRREGYHVLVAAGGAEAMDVLARHVGAVDLLLTDVVMAGMDGRELHRAVAERDPGVKVLYMSGYTDEVVAHRGVSQDGVPFVQKPFSVAVLTQKVREVLES